MTVHVRLAAPEELDAAGRAVRLAYEHEGYTGGYLSTVADARDRARDAAIAVAVTADGEVLGSVTFVEAGSRWAELAGPGEGEFRMLGVLPAARGSGAGGALVDWCVHRARDLGCTRLVLSSLPQMVPAHRLYLARGFVRQPSLDRTPVPGETLIGFALDLRPANAG